jgi:hypothetical protein
VEAVRAGTKKVAENLKKNLLDLYMVCTSSRAYIVENREEVLH